MLAIQYYCNEIEKDVENHNSKKLPLLKNLLEDIEEFSVKEQEFQVLFDSEPLYKINQIRNFMLRRSQLSEPNEFAVFKKEINSKNDLKFLLILNNKIIIVIYLSPL